MIYILTITGFLFGAVLFAGMTAWFEWMMKPKRDEGGGE